MTRPDFNAIATDQYVARRDTLAEAYEAVRAHSRNLTSRFSEAEQQLQSMPDASPTKWHLAHTTWFFETFILKPCKPGFEWYDEHFCYLFNSYYNAVGSQYPRPKRGLISRPDLNGVWDYRGHVDGDMERLLKEAGDEQFATLAPILVLGLNHEQQHQELIRTDIKHGLYQAAHWGQGKHGPAASVPPVNSGANDFYSSPDVRPAEAHAHEWLAFEGGEAGIGYAGKGFCFDNELARHAVLLQPFEISNRLVTAGDWLEFMEDGGYESPLLWLSDGWFWRRDNDITAPLYWRKFDGRWHRFAYPCRSNLPVATSSAWQPVDANEPVRHVSYYEADAFAEWRGARLPREAEWEAFVTQDGDDPLHHRGSAWEWTQSAYGAYPGFKPTPGLAGEYNGKFMVNQMVLRGASPATSPFHSRPSYRNFFYPDAQWQYTGVRLARDL